VNALEPVTLSAGAATAVVAARGAELTSWRVGGREYLWDGTGDWPIHAPMLFPVICRVPGDVLTVAGTGYPMVEHGFGRHRTFELVERSEEAVTFALTHDAETRAAYPYAFGLQVEHRLDDRGITSRFTVSNHGDVVLPFELGHHPSYRWPLAGTDRSGHVVVLDEQEPAGSRRLADGLLDPVERPAVHQEVALEDALFAESAVILTDVRSRGLEYRGPGGAGLRVTWDGFTGVTLWSPVSDDFVCLEAWRGRPALAGQVDFAARPDVARVEPGGRTTLCYRVEVLPGSVSGPGAR
jgi:galactose mutarotase-like enzyme